MALDVFFEVVVPLLEMETTALIAISTPLDGLNFYSEMFELKGADGKPLFNTLRVGLSCQKCQDEGKAESCTHMKDVIRKLIYLFCLQLNLILTISLAPWKSAAKFDMVAAIYGDRKDLLARESMGQMYVKIIFSLSKHQLTSSTVRTTRPLYSLKSLWMSSWDVRSGS
jgi:hypothetical protein